MTRQDRFRYEMFVRVRDYGMAQTDLFPESSKAGRAFAEVAAAVTAINVHAKNRMLASAEVRRVKAATRAAVHDYMKAIAKAGRRITLPESGENPFRIPRRRTLAVEVSAARAFIEEAEKRQDQFVELGLPPTFISDFRALVDTFEQAVDQRLSSKTLRRQAKAGIETTLSQGLDVIRNLDVIVEMATRRDPIRFAAYQTARRIEGQGSSSSPAAEEPPAVPPVAVPPETKEVALDRAPEVLGRAS